MSRYGSLAGDAAVALVLLAVVLLTACGAAQPQPADLTAFAAQQNECVVSASTKAEADACRSVSLGQWCAKWPSSAVCSAGDAGGQ